MAVRGRRILEGVGGDILNPRNGGGAYDDMLRALHDVMEAHDPVSHANERAMCARTSYEHLEGVVDGAGPGTYADLLSLYWNRSDWQVNGGAFSGAEVSGSNPLYQLRVDIHSGKAAVIDHEQSVKRRVGQRTLLAMTRGVTVDDMGNFPDNRVLSTGYAIIPTTQIVDIRGDSIEVTGDSVRRALEPFEAQLAAIAKNLAYEAQRSTEEQ